MQHLWQQTLQSYLIKYGKLIMNGYSSCHQHEEAFDCTMECRETPSIRGEVWLLSRQKRRTHLQHVLDVVIVTWRWAGSAVLRADEVVGDWDGPDSIPYCNTGIMNILSCRILASIELICDVNNHIIAIAHRSSSTNS